MLLQFRRIEQVALIVLLRFLQGVPMRNSKWNVKISVAGFWPSPPSARFSPATCWPLLSTVPTCC